MRYLKLFEDFDWSDEEATPPKGIFVLLVTDMKNGKEEWMRNSYEEDGVILGITAYYNNFAGDEMIDQHIVEHFPELEQLGIQDETEGFMSYNNTDLTAEEMVQKLKKLGFIARLDK
jgi:hypothetical protein